MNKLNDTKNKLITMYTKHTVNKITNLQLAMSNK